LIAITNRGARRLPDDPNDGTMQYWLSAESRSMPESDRDLVRRAAAMGAFYRPGDQPDAVELFDALVDRLLALEERATSPSRQNRNSS
jgi:hypothetical protein